MDFSYAGAQSAKRLGDATVITAGDLCIASQAISDHFTLCRMVFFAVRHSIVRFACYAGVIQ